MSQVISLPGTSNLILSSPHSGRQRPKGIELKLNEDSEQVMATLERGVDVSVPLVTDFKSYDSAARIWTDIYRAILDPNRLINQVDGRALQAAAPATFPHGLIWASTLQKYERDIEDMLTGPYDRATFEKLVALAHTPFETYIQQAMDAAHKKHGIAIHWDLHSMAGAQPTYVQNGRHKNAYICNPPSGPPTWDDKEMPEIIFVEIGKEPTYSKLVQDTVIEVFRSHGISADVLPMAPVAISPYIRFANPSQNRHCFATEISGYVFEPGRMDGDLTIDTTHLAKFQAAFKDTFRALEQIQPD